MDRTGETVVLQGLRNFILENLLEKLLLQFFSVNPMLPYKEFMIFGILNTQTVLVFTKSGSAWLTIMFFPNWEKK